MSPISGMLSPRLMSTSPTRCLNQPEPRPMGMLPSTVGRPSSDQAVATRHRSAPTRSLGARGFGALAGEPDEATVTRLHDGSSSRIATSSTDGGCRDALRSGEVSLTAVRVEQRRRARGRHAMFGYWFLFWARER